MSNFCQIPASILLFPFKTRPSPLGTFHNKKKGFACKVNKSLKNMLYVTILWGKACNRLIWVIIRTLATVGIRMNPHWFVSLDPNSGPDPGARKSTKITPTTALVGLPGSFKSWSQVRNRIETNAEPQHWKKEGKTILKKFYYKICLPI